MPIIKAYKAHKPQIADGVFIAENATIVGEVELQQDSSIWYNAVIRGDVGKIQVGERTNVQDFAMMHCSTGRTPTIVGNDVTIGHHAIIHGCTIEDEVLIGMGAIVMDEVVIEKHVIVAAGAVVLEGKRLESGFLYAGVPARKIKPLSPENREAIREGATHYVEKGKFH